MLMRRSGIEPDWLTSSAPLLGSSTLSTRNALARRPAAALGLRCALRRLVTMTPPRLGTLLRLAESLGARSLASGYWASTAGPEVPKPETANPVPVSASSNPAEKHAMITSEEAREKTSCGVWTSWLT